MLNIVSHNLNILYYLYNVYCINLKLAQTSDAWNRSKMNNLFSIEIILEKYIYIYIKYFLQLNSIDSHDSKHILL